MKLFPLLALMIAAPLVGQINPSMSTSQIQSALTNASSGSTVTFAAGNYNISSPLNIPCSNLALTGPAGSKPTAILSASYNNNPLFIYPSSCGNLGSIKYLGFMNTGAVYIGGGNSSNFTFEYNSVGNLPSLLSNNTSESGIYFDGDLSATFSNVVVTNNTFGDSNSCAAAFATVNDSGGYCAGVLIGAGTSKNVNISSNVFNHVEEGLHFFQLASWNPGQPGSNCVTCVVNYNYVLNYHRIAIEIQIDTPTDSVQIQHNSLVDPLNSSWGTFAFSLACCQWGTLLGTAGFSPGYVFNDNLAISSQPPGSKPPPYAVEFWGTGSQGTNSLLEGNFSNGYTWGYGSSPWAINNNYICGPNYVSQGGYISNQQGQSNPPSQVGNVTGPSCSTQSSVAPVIAISGGTVTLTDNSINTGIYYTTDGTTPVAGTSARYSAPFTVAANTTIKAIGMWGAANQPTSYPAGYGYVPSAVVSANSGGVTPGNCLTITLNIQTGQGTQTMTGTFKTAPVACN